MPDINETLAERGKKHGKFRDHAAITQSIKTVISTWRRDEHTNTMRESLDMIAHKMGRILAGDPTEPDHWHDIAGYATLVERELTSGGMASGAGLQQGPQIGRDAFKPFAKSLNEQEEGM